MELGLKDKRVVVTGASTGIGYAAAEQFLKEGAYVTIAARGEERLNEAVAKLSKIAGSDKVDGIVADCSIAQDVEKLGEFAAKEGSIDVWVNNVGTNRIRKGELYTEEEIDFLIGANLKSTIFGSQVAFKYMKKNGGSIVNIASLAARTASCGRATLYGALKSGVVGLTNTTAGEYAAYGIRVNAVLPGFTATDLTLRSWDNKNPEELNKSINNILLRRMADPSETANAIVFLASDAASFITAESLEVSGGHNKVLNPGYSYENKKE